MTCFPFRLEIVKHWNFSRLFCCEFANMQANIDDLDMFAEMKCVNQYTMDIINGFIRKCAYYYETNSTKIVSCT